MKNLKNEVWVTSASMPEEAKKCLVLAKSLKMSFTNRRTAIFVNADMESSLKGLLSCVFDHVYSLDGVPGLSGTQRSKPSFHELAKISVLKLHSFEKCVYLSPNSLVLRNADNIFDFGNAGDNGKIKLVFPKECGKHGDIGAIRVFGVVPNIQAYRHIWNEWTTTEKYDLKEMMEHYFMERGETLCFSHFDEMFWAELDAEDSCRTNCDVSIVTFMDDPLTLFGKKLGILENLSLKLWTKLHTDVEGEMLDESPMMEIPRYYSKEPVAIVGMSCRYPSSSNLDDFWKVLLEDRDCTRAPPGSRLQSRTAEKGGVPCGYLDAPLDEFDSKFFGISPTELVQMDPQHRLLHEVMWEALEDAAVDPSKLESTNGSVFLGTWKMDYKDILTEAGYSAFYRKYMGNSIGSGAARIAFHLGLTGPCIGTESGCSTSMVAVHMACSSLLNHDTSVALACGANLILTHLVTDDLPPTMLSPNGKCKTFDAKADGYARAEGVGVLVLKRLSDAVRDNDKIWALIRGSAIAQEGLSPSLGTPTVHSETLAITQALDDAGVEPEQVSYLELHGTGTPTGDPVEAKAIANAYFSKKRKEPLLMASAKTIVGHTEACSGMLGIMKVALQMKHGVIAPHRNLDELNPEINLELIPAKIPLEAVEWTREDGERRIAGVSSFGITGTDAHVLLEEAPEEINNWKFVTDFKRPLNILKISAKTEKAFDLLVEKYLEHLRRDFAGDGKEEVGSLHNICYTGNAGRADFQFRTCFIGGSREEMIATLEKKNSVESKRIPDSRPKICFLFPGQGCEYPEMAKELYETSPVFRVHFDYCAKILDSEYKINLAKVLWSTELNSMSRSIDCHCAILTVEYALFKLWESWGVTPDFCLGHCLGELVAAACGGILSVEDAFKLVVSRGLLVESKCRPGRMLAVGGGKSVVLARMMDFAGKDSSKILDFAAFNSEEQTVVAGDVEVVQGFSEYLKREGALKCKMLQSDHAHHSRHMDIILDEYEHILNSVKIADSSAWKFGYISGVHGGLVKSASELGVGYWLDHCRQPVNFVEASNTATQHGSTIFLEVGPHPILSALQMMNTTNVEISCLPSLKRSEDNWTTMLESLKVLYTSGADVDWIGFDKLYDRSKVSSLPTYPFIRKRFWPDNSRNLQNRNDHPLLGHFLPNATSKNIFQVGLNLAELDYIKDHAVGENVIYPAACFVETMLAAGKMSLGRRRRKDDLTKNGISRLKLENVVIQAPLRLEDGITTQVQTVTRDSGNNCGLQVKIFRKSVGDKDEGDEEENVWQPHAYGTVVPSKCDEDDLAFDLDLDKFEKTIELSQSDDKFIEDIYAKLDIVGLKFGEKFRSLEKVWRDKEGSLSIAKVKFPPNQTYILHPVLIDAMIQALLIFRDVSTALMEDLRLPVRIGKFVWVAGGGETAEMDGDLYVHVDHSSQSAALVRSTGRTIAIMSDAEFVCTTLPAFNSSLEQSSTSELPTLWEEVWTGTRGSMQHRLNFDSMPELFFTKDFVQRTSDSCNILREENLEIWQLLEKFVFYNVLKGLYECGWEGDRGNHKVCLDALLKSLGIVEEHRRIVGFYLTILESEGILRKADDGNWNLINGMVPSYAEVKEQLGSSTFTNQLVQLFPSTKLLGVLGDNLAKILKGERMALQILFPDTLQDSPSVTQFYEEYFEVTQGLDLGSQIAEQRLQFWKEQMAGEKFVFRILEIGAGTGGYTSVWIDALEKLGIDYEFHYTDISPGFFPAAGKKFEKFRGKMRFEKLNIEEDLLSQGFLPDYFDYIVASEVIHATRDIRESLGNVRKVLRNGGCFDIFEQTKVNRVLSYTFGCLEGFWRFEDYDLRRDHCTMSAQQWEVAFSQSGYSFTQAFHCCHDYHAIICAQKRDNLEISRTTELVDKSWIVFKPTSNNQLVEKLIQKLVQSCNRRVVIMQPGDTYRENTYSLPADAKYNFESLMEALSDSQEEVEGILYAWALDKDKASQSEILQPYLNIVQTLENLKQKTLPRVVALTSGVFQTEENNRIDPHHSTLWGFTKSMKNENKESICRCVDVENSTNVDEVFHEIWNGDRENQVSFSRGNARLLPRLRQLKASPNSMPLPKGTERFQVSLPKSGQISDLSFAPLEQVHLGGDEVEVEARAVALNFRDIVILIKPDAYFASLKITSFGSDVAGVVKRVGSLVTKWRPGDRVVGILSGVFQSHRIAHEDILARIPDEITFPEAATLPLVFATVYTSLVDVASVKPEDTVLIHTASGGVGLAAIELCRHLGVSRRNIFCTAGSERKRNFLRESYGIVNVFSSRSTEYSHKILELTHGRGVNIVLNTLTSEGFKEATLAALAKNGHFVELSKLDVWKASQVSEMRHDANYNIVDVSDLSREEYKRFIEILSTFLEKGSLSPLPYTRFDGVDLRQAMEFMLKAKHVGKVVCILPQQSKSGQGLGKVITPMFNENGTYLITGGLGGVGFEVAKWMLTRGAKHLLLLGRSSPSAEVQKEIEKLNSDAGANILTSQVDVSNYSQLRSILENLENRSLPNLKGVMHCAGTLRDGAIQSFESWSTFSSPLKTKVEGTWNLHKLTTDLDMKLEHFVLFSSLSALIGTPGQSNYAAGNCFEDALAHYRHSVGLPATSVNWGTWAEVGLAANIDVPGISGMSTAQGLAALEYAMTSQRVQSCAVNFSSFQKLSKWAPQAVVYLDEMMWKINDGHTTAQSTSEPKLVWETFYELTSFEERSSLVEGMLTGILRNILKLDLGDIIEAEDNFGDLGVDSLMFVEIRNAVQVELGKRVVVNVGVIRESECLKELTKALLRLLDDNVTATVM